MNRITLTIACFLMVVGVITCLQWLAKLSDWIEGFFHEPPNLVSSATRRRLETGGRKR